MRVTVRTWDDPLSWNSFVRSTPHPHFQQSWEWGELAPDLGGEAVRLAALGDGRMVAAAQVFINPLSRTGRTHLYIPRGPAATQPSMETVGPLLDQIRLLGYERGAVGLCLESSASSDDLAWRHVLNASGMRPTFPANQPRSSWLLDLTLDTDDLLAQMKQKTRYNIRLAGRKGVSVHEAGADDLDTFYDLYQLTAQRDDFFIQTKGIYARMFSLYREAGNFCMLFAYYQGRPIAAVTVLRFGPTCWYWQGASSSEHRNLMAPYLLQWEAIQRAKQWGCRLYDFRAVPDVLDEDQDMYGVYRFKEGFGGYHFTVMDTHSVAYDPLLFGMWQLYYRARFDLTAWRRQRKGLSVRQFA